MTEDERKRQKERRREKHERLTRAVVNARYTKAQNDLKRANRKAKRALERINATPREKLYVSRGEQRRASQEHTSEEQASEGEEKEE